MIGKTLNHYTVEAQLGVGGMGEVYLARDTRLGRSVAVKVLPEAFDQDADSIVRFEREARLLASLNHPNIASLYGMEKAGSKHFLVMELVEGETLAERMRRGPIAIEEALKFGQQMAEALEAAHQSGVVHRDLKPANVKITSDNKIKVLDFGLAKAMENAPANLNISNSPTISMHATNAGVILGTAAYMSPEQAKGLTADSRSDIFSLGCLLFEMLSGRQPFQGDTTSELLASVLVREPDWTLLPANVKPRVHDLVRRCMDKNPRRRWQAAGDVRMEIETLLSEPLGVVAQSPTTVAPHPLWRRGVPVLMTALLVGLATGFAVWNLKPSAPAQIYRYEVPLPGYRIFNLGPWNVLAISPDGTKLVYAMNNQLHLYLMETGEHRPISGANGEIGNIFFSPDGQWVGFWAIRERMLKKIAITGGVPIKICDTPSVSGATWDGNRIVFAQPQKGIMHVSEDGGEPQVLVPIPSNQLAHGPQILAGGKAVLFTLGINSNLQDWDSAEVVLQPLPSGKPRRIVQGASDARVVASGHLIYSLGRSVMAEPFDLKTLDRLGGPVAVVDKVMRSPIGLSAATQIAFADNGTLVYIPVGPNSFPDRRTLAIAGKNNTLQRLKVPPLPYLYPRFSPDGSQIVVATEDSKGAMVHVYDLSGGASLRPLTFQGRNTNPIWSADSRYVIYSSVRDGKLGIFRKLANGSGLEEPLIAGEESPALAPQSAHRLGSVLALYRAGGIQTLLLDGDRKPTPLLQVGRGAQVHATFSPDGKWITYMSTENGAPQVFVRPYPLTESMYLIADNAAYPAWSPNGERVFYYYPPDIYSVDVRTEPTFWVGEKHEKVSIVGSIHPSPALLRNYDIHPKTGEVLVVLPADSEVAREDDPKIKVVLNWFEDLRKRVPIP